MGQKQMSNTMVLVVVLTVLLCSEAGVWMVSGRYLPTRSQDDKIERLRELLKDLLESQMSSRQQQELNFDQEALSSSPQMVGLGSGGIGPSGTILYKRDIQQGNSGFYPLNNSSQGKKPLSGLLFRRK